MLFHLARWSGVVGRWFISFWCPLPFFKGQQKFVSREGHQSPFLFGQSWPTWIFPSSMLRTSFNKKIFSQMVGIYEFSDFRVIFFHPCQHPGEYTSWGLVYFRGSSHTEPPQPGGPWMLTGPVGSNAISQPSGRWSQLDERITTPSDLRRLEEMGKNWGKRSVDPPGLVGIFLSLAIICICMCTCFTHRWQWKNGNRW